jgi:hypothetical protein
MADPALPAWLTASDVERAVRSLPGLHGASLMTWSGGPLVGGGGECLGVWRLEGLAMLEGEPTRWSIVLKGWAREVSDDPPSAWNWPYREMELYRSGMLDDLPGGIRAPRYYGDLERDDGSVWVWLEDITDGVQAPWPIDRYETIARQLGQFNGAWLVDHLLPDAPFLSRDWLRGWVDRSTPALHALMADTDLARRSGAYPPGALDAYGRLWARRHAIYDELARLPQTFCHLDAFSRNIFIRERVGEPDDTVLIDWSFAGIGAIGEELVPLVGASIGFLDAPVSDIAEMSESALTGYIAGLRDAGWDADAAAVRWVFQVGMGLRYGLGVTQFVLLGLVDPDSIPTIEKNFGHPFGDIMATLCALNAWVVDSAALREDKVPPSSPPA